MTRITARYVFLGTVLFGLVAITGLSNTVKAAAGVAASYSMNEGAGTSITDTSGNGITGTLTNGPTWVAGKYSNAVKFDGSNDYINLGNPAVLQMTGSMTVSAWIYATANPTDDGQIVAKSDESSGWQLKTSPDTGVHTFGIKAGGAQRYSATVRQLNTWYYVTGVYNATAKTLDIYVNGVLNNGVLIGTIPASQTNASVNVNIGRRTNGYYFQGTIDDVRIYNRALTVAEIQSDMTTPVGGSPIPDSVAPTVSLISPVSGTFASSTSFIVSATASDNIAVAGVQFKLDGINLGAEDMSSPYSIIWNTTTASSGAHTLSAVARDSAGNTATTTPITVTVDNQAPTGTILINNGAVATNSVSANLNLSGTDLLGTVIQMRFSNTGSSFNAPVAYALTAPWTLTTGSGTKTVYAQFRDQAGNWSASFTDTITLDTTAPTISAVASSGFSNNSATITWTTNEPATSQVNYGTTVSYGATTTLDTTLVTAHSVVISGLNSQTLYNYRVRSKDTAGNERVGTNSTFTTLSGPDTTSPSVPTNFSAISISSSQINLSWTASTDNVGVVGYKIYRCQGIGCSQTVQVATSTGTTFNNINLLPLTSYSYQVSAYDAAGNVSAQSAIVNVTTQPTISTKFTIGQRVEASANVNVRATASSSGTLLGTQTTGNLGTVVSGPTVADGFNWWNVNYDTGVDGWSTEDFLVPYVDVTAPTISNIVTSNITQTGVTITWTTNEPGTSQVDYGLTTTYGQSSPLNNTLVTNHSVTIAGLTNQTTYNFVVKSMDGAGNASVGTNSMFTTLTQGSGVAGPLRALSTNPNYFTDGTGKAIYLTGSHTWNNFQDWGQNGVVQPFDFTAYVNMMVSHGQNFTLLWNTELPHFCGLPTTASNPPDFTVSPQPWLRTGPGLASDGLPKFDLTQFNQAFFDRLRSRAEQLNSAGIYTGVYFFSGEWLNAFRCVTDGYPFTGSNNINSIDDIGGSNSVTMNSPNAITAIQDALVDKMIDTLNDLPNVIWIVSEEAPTFSGWWNNHIISHARTYEALKPFQHPIGYGVLTDFNDSIQTNSDADWVAPGVSISPTRTCGTGQPPCKVNINDGDHSQWGMWNNGAQENRGFFWYNMMTGNQSIFMDPYVIYYPRENRNLCANPVNGICATPDIRWENVRSNMGYTRDYANRMNLAAMLPHGNLSSTGYALANIDATNSEFLVFAPFGGSFTVNLSNTTRNLNVEWLNPATGVKTAGTSFVGGSGAKSFTPPFSGDAVLYIYDSALGTSDTIAPSVPTNLSAVAVSSSQINLSWATSTDNVAVTGYKVFRGGVQIATTTTTSYTNSGLSASTNYVYTVSTYDGAGNVSALSAPANTTTPAMMVVSNVQTSNITPSGVTVTWTTSQPATSAVELGPTSSYGSITSEDPTLVTSHSVIVTGLTSNTTYHFRTHSADVSDVHMYSSDGVFSTLSSGSGGTFQNEILVTNLDFPDSLEFLPDGSMLVAELTGKIKRVLPGATQAEPVPFMQITNIGSEGGLQGLFDIELDPNYATNHYFYVFYTMGNPNFDRLSRFTADPSGTSASLSSEFVIYQDTVDSGSDHHGGSIVFGNDGKIYVTVGEHFTSISQDLTSSRGKVLRYNPDGTIPTDNPFYDGAGPNYDAVWAYGFRNPFRMTVDRPTGRIFVADVGGNNPPTAREEVNLLNRGANYSWPNCEGVCGAVDPGDPIYDYSHFAPSGGTRDASITGGFVYRGTQFPVSYQGSYFFGDYTQNWIRHLTFDASGNTVTGMQFFEPADGSLDAPIGAVVCLTQGPDGALYYCDLGWENESTLTGGKIRRIKFNSNNQAPVVQAAGLPLTGVSPLTVNFSSIGTSDPDSQPQLLTYDWDFGDGVHSTLPNPQHIYTTNGQYTVRLSVSDGNLTTLGDPIVVRVGNSPQATILSPNDGTFFNGGDVISFSGDGSDLDDGTLPLSAFTWNIDFLHDGHIHPGSSFTGTKSGTFTIPTSGHDFQGNTRYRIMLTVTDSSGLQTSSSIIVWPNKVNLTFNSSPNGLNFTLDGITHSTPLVYDTLIGYNHTINAPNQSQGSNNYTFASWSDGGVQQHTLLVPNSAQSYLATYNIVQNVATPVFVKMTETVAVASSAVVSTPNFASAVGNGNLIVVWVWYNTATQNVNSVTDTKGNIYTRAGSIVTGSGSMINWRQELWYAKNVVGGTSLAITANFTGSFSTEKALTAHEYSGLDTVNPLDGVSGAATATANATTPSVTTLYPKELIFGSALFQGFGSSGSGFTQRSSINSNATEDKVVSTTGSYNATFTNGAQSTLVNLATFKAAGQ